MQLRQESGSERRRLPACRLFFVHKKADPAYIYWGFDYRGRIGFDRAVRSASCVPWLVSRPR